jgi:hypothetical protein
LVNDRVAGQPCRICSEPIKPGEPVSFQDGELVHMTCYNDQSQATRRRRETTYKDHTVQLFCYPLMGRWRPAAIVESPGRARSTRLGRMELCDSAQGALAFALKTATDWIDKSAAKAARVEPTHGEDN